MTPVNSHSRNKTEKKSNQIKFLRRINYLIGHISIDEFESYTSKEMNFFFISHEVYKIYVKKYEIFMEKERKKERNKQTNKQTKL